MNGLVYTKKCYYYFLKNIYQDILTVLGYKFDNETVHQTHAKVEKLIDGRYEILNFSCVRTRKYFIYLPDFRSKQHATSNI